MIIERSDKVVNDVCWLACFDILGFKDELDAHRRDYWYQHGVGYLSILVEAYQEAALRAIEAHKRAGYGRFANVPWYYAHFSDTFLFYSPGDSLDSNLVLDSIARCFFVEMIHRGMPLRGAVTCGEFYADRERNVYVGPALVEAYEYAEKQDWIGYVLTPQAREKLSGTEFDPARSIDYVEYDVPVKPKERVIPGREKPIVTGKERLFAFRASKCPGVYDSIREMSQHAKNQMGTYYNSCQSKYDNTLRFLESTRLKSMNS